MKSEILVNLVYEDDLSCAVLQKLLDCSIQNYSVGMTYSAGGSGYIYKKIKGFNNAAKGMSFLVLTDLDQHECPPELIRHWFGSEPIHRNLVFRVAVKEVESWILAGRKSLAGYLGINVDNIPQNSDAIRDPKLLLLGLVQKSRKGELKRDILPRKGSTARVGPDYNGRMVQFVKNHWDIQEAQSNSNSLSRAIRVLNEYQPKFTKV